MSIFGSLYTDENMDVRVAKLLRAKGFDVVTAQECGMLGKPDREQFQYAIAGERAIVTHDHRDFLRLHEEWLAGNHQHAGIVLTAVRSPAETAQRLANLLDRYTSDELRNGLFYV